MKEDGRLDRHRLILFFFFFSFSSSSLLFNIMLDLTQEAKQCYPEKRIKFKNHYFSLV